MDMGRLYYPFPSSNRIVVRKEAIKPSENVYCLFRKTFTIEKPIVDTVITVPLILATNYL